MVSWKGEPTQSERIMAVLKEALEIFRRAREGGEDPAGGRGRVRLPGGRKGREPGDPGSCGSGGRDNGDVSQEPREGDPKSRTEKPRRSIFPIIEKF